MTLLGDTAVTVKYCVKEIKTRPFVYNGSSHNLVHSYFKIKHLSTVYFEYLPWVDITQVCTCGVTKWPFSRCTVNKIMQGISNGIHSFINIIGDAGAGSVKIGRVLHP